MVKNINRAAHLLLVGWMEWYEATISSKGQMTLPKKLREKYRLEKGEKALVIPSSEGILIKHKTVSLRGIWKGKGDPKEFEKAIRELREEWRL